MFSEPGATQGDIHFRLFGFPVRIHPMFWLVALLLGPLNAEPILTLLWVPAVLISIVFHELGHALVMRRFGAWPHIVLYWLGGLAVPDGNYPRRPGTGGRISISLAGPGAGFLLAALIVAALMAARQTVVLYGPWWWLTVIPEVDMPNYPLVDKFLNYLLRISVFWGLINLLPVYPLDGGQAAEDFLAAVSPREGVRQAMMISMVTAGLLATYWFVEWARSVGAAPKEAEFRGLFRVAMFGYLAYLSYMRLKSFGRGPWW